KGSACAAFSTLLTHLDEHLVLRHAHTLPVAPLCSQEILHTGAHSLEDSGKLPDWRGYCSMNDVGGFLYAIHSAVQEFVGTNDLQARAIDNIVQCGINALDLRTHQCAALAGILD